MRHLGSGGRAWFAFPDPDPENPHRPTGAAWWPPAMLDPDRARHADFDVFHLHFGFDACAPDSLDKLTRVPRGRGKPFVFTVHDLRTPHQNDRQLHDDQLDVLVPAADAVITLTLGGSGLPPGRTARDDHQGTGRLADSSDIEGLARAVSEAASLDRSQCREHAVTEPSLERMVDSYKCLYERLIRSRKWGDPLRDRAEPARLHFLETALIALQRECLPPNAASPSTMRAHS